MRYISEWRVINISDFIANFDYFCRRNKIPRYIKYKPVPEEGRHLIKYRKEKDYEYYICDYCGAEIKILENRLQMTGGIDVLPHTITRRGEVKLVTCNKCLLHVVEELDNMER